MNVARHPEQSAVHHFPLNAGKCKPVYSMSQSAIEHMLLRPFVCCLLNDHYCLHNWESWISDQDIDRPIWIICIEGVLRSRQVLYQTLLSIFQLCHDLDVCYSFYIQCRAMIYHNEEWWPSAQNRSLIWPLFFGKLAEIFDMMNAIRSNHPGSTLNVTVNFLYRGSGK